MTKKHAAPWLHRQAAPVGASRTLTRDHDGEVHFTYDATALSEIIVRGTNLLRGTGGCYVIGSCGGPDSPAQNVVSTGSDGHTLAAPGSCPGSPFAFRCQRLDGRTLLLDVSIGPLAAPHQFMSVPMDTAKDLVAAFAFVNAGYLVGCGNTWTPRSGHGGPFTSIPTPCVIPMPAPNRVGVARPDRLEPYLEVVAPGLATIRRTLVTAGSLQEGTYTNHPGTNCLDWSWVRGWPGVKRLAAGSVLAMREQITVTPADAGPITGAPTFTTPPRVTALTTTAVRVEWATAPATTATLNGWRDADPGNPTTMSVTSPWTYTMLMPATSYTVQITIRDTAGRTTTSAPVRFTTLPEDAPPPPDEVTMKVRIDVPAQSATIDLATGPTNLSINLSITPLGSIDPPDPPDPPPGTARAPMPIGVSNVATMDAEEAEAVLSAGCTLVQAEGIPFDAEKPGGQGINAWDIDRLVGIAEVVARYPDSVFFCTVVNANGAKQMQQDTTWFRARVQEVLDRVMPLLGARLWIEGVSEPGDSGKSDEWCRVTRDMLSGKPAVLVGNGPGGRGVPRYGGRVDWHYCDANDMRKSINERRDRIHSTDCTPCLASNLSETFIRAVTREALALRQHVIWYDTDNAPALNREVLRWVSEEIQAAFTPPPTGDPYKRWPNTGIVTALQIKGIYLELLRRDPDPGGMQHYLTARMTPACTWLDIRNSPEYKAKNPGAGNAAPPPGGCSGIQPPPTGSADAVPISEIIWIRDNESDVEHFTQTATLSDVRFDGQEFNFDLSNITAWPAGSVDRAPANFLSGIQVDGQWYMSAWEWMGHDTRARRVEGGRDLGWALSNGTGGNPNEVLVRANPPHSGDEVLAMVSSVVRGPERTVNERSNIVKVRMA